MVGIPLRVAVASFVAALGVCAPAGGRTVQTIGDDGPQKLRFAQNLAIGPTGSIYVLDASGTFPDPRVLVNVYSPAGKTLRSWQVPSATTTYDLAVDGAGDVYVVLMDERRVVRYSSKGRVLASWRAPATGDGFPRSITIDGGHVLVAVSDGRIDSFDVSGALIGSPWVLNADAASSIAATASGRVYFASARGIGVLDRSGGARYIAGGPQGHVEDGARAIAAGPQNTAYTLGGPSFGLSGERIQRISSAGRLLGSVGIYDFYRFFSDLAVASDGSIFASSRGRGAVYRFPAITTLDRTPPFVDDLDAAPRADRVRLRYRLSERSIVRVILARRPVRGKHKGRLVYAGQFERPAAGAGRHVLTLDRREFTPSGRTPPGRYRVSLIAIDDAGLQSRAARVSFSFTRRPAPTA